jgi:hypothetical protein
MRSISAPRALARDRCAARLWFVRRRYRGYAPFADLRYFTVLHPRWQCGEWFWSMCHPARFGTVLRDVICVGGFC